MGFLNPAAFVFSAFIAGLVLLYLWERQQRRLDVPSLLLWQIIPEAVIRRRRFQPDPLFWLQLAGLAALLLGLANPYLDIASHSDVASRLILVIDLSASMQADEGGATRLDMAREQAVRVIRASPPDAEIMIIGAAREPTILAPFDRDHGAAIDVLQNLHAKDIPAQIEPALAIAQRASFQADADTALHAFTDVPRESVGARWREGVNWWPVGTDDDNLAIADVQTTRGILQNHPALGARIAVRNFGTKEKHGSLTVRIADEIVAQELFTAPPHSTQNFHIRDLAAFGLLEASLKSEDALELDNHWRTWIPQVRPVRIALIDATPELADAMSRLDRAVESIVVVSPTDAAASADIVIYHHSIPDRIVDNAATLVIAPSADLGTLQPADELANAVLVDWTDGHEVLRGIDPRLLQSFTSLKVVHPPAWGEAVLSAQLGNREVPALIVGKPGNHRMAVLAVDLGKIAFFTSDREPLLLLFLNLIDWLADQRGDVDVSRTGESKLISDPDNPIIRVIDPAGGSTQIDPDQSSLAIDYAGTYQIERRNGDRTIFLANFQDSDESNIGRTRMVPYVATARVDPGNRLTTGSGFGKWFYAVAAMLLLAEWAFANRPNAHG